jgi:twitching motility protein PilT
MIEPQQKNLLTPTTAWLHDLPFVDLYVSLYSDLPSYYQVQTPGTMTVLPRDLPDEYHDDIVQLREQLAIALKDHEETGLTYDGVRLRASKIVTPRGETWVALRRIDDLPPPIENLGFNLPLVHTLHTLGAREGLILICGGTGQGKSTTAASMFYDYLVRFGGVAMTIEDPVEYLLEGRHGESGLCYQVEVKEETDWEKHLKSALRWHPRYILVGELRTPEAANQLLRAANSGHLVITTVHSGSLEEGLEGLLQLGERAIGEQARTLLASGLTAVFHQTFMAHSVAAQMYVTDSINMGDPVRALIREHKIGEATTFVDRQTAQREQAFGSISRIR